MSERAEAKENVALEGAPKHFLEVGLGNEKGTSLIDLSPGMLEKILKGTLDYWVLEPRERNHQFHQIGTLVGVSLQTFVRSPQYERFNGMFSRVFIGNVLGDAYSGLTQPETLHDIFTRMRDKLDDGGEVLVVESISPDVADVVMRSLLLADIGYEVVMYRGYKKYIESLSAENICETPEAGAAKKQYEQRGMSYIPFIFRLKKKPNAR